MAYAVLPVTLLKFLFSRRFVSLSKEKKRQNSILSFLVFSIIIQYLYRLKMD